MKDHSGRRRAQSLNTKDLNPTIVFLGQGGSVLKLNLYGTSNRGVTLTRSPHRGLSMSHASRDSEITFSKYQIKPSMVS